MPGDDDLDSLPLERGGRRRLAQPGHRLVGGAGAGRRSAARAAGSRKRLRVAPPRPAPSDDLPPEMIRLQKVLAGSRQPPRAAKPVHGSGDPGCRAGCPQRPHGHSAIHQPVQRGRLEGNERGRAIVEDAINRTLGSEPGTYKVKVHLEGPRRSRLAQGRAASRRSRSRRASRPGRRCGRAQARSDRALCGRSHRRVRRAIVRRR